MIPTGIIVEIFKDTNKGRGITVPIFLTLVVDIEPIIMMESMGQRVLLENVTKNQQILNPVLTPVWKILAEKLMGTEMTAFVLKTHPPPSIAFRL